MNEHICEGMVSLILAQILTVSRSHVFLIYVARKGSTSRMSSLYRRYRPSSFGEVLGQSHVTVALEAALKTDRLSHAYLFSGPRGTGKTTTARLLAKAANCLAKKSRPCNSCANCKLINASSSVDIIEIDAASNRGIDEIRDLREKILFAPTALPYKVYIIDEVHMLTKEAFNALLKTLEEPPAHAIFILATTELHRVPETVISRCQRYQFHRATDSAIGQVLRTVGQAEKIALSDDVVSLLARHADGSFRDALTVLGNIATLGGSLDEAAVRQAIGLPSQWLSADLLGLLLGGQSQALLEKLRTHLGEGGNLAVVLRDVTDECETRLFTAGAASDPSLLRVFEALLETAARLRHATNPDALILAKFLSLSASFTLSRVTKQPVVDHIQKVEVTKDETAAVDALSEPTSSQSPPSGDFWGSFLEAVKQRNHALYAICRSALFEQVTEDKFTIAVKFRFYLERLFEKKNRQTLEQIATALVGRPMRLECEVKADLKLPTNKGEDILGAVVDVFELEEVG